jgi:GNAT superfamily N-acetyltransferase
MLALRLLPVTDALPAGFAAMREEAAREGHRHLERLAGDWASCVMRFDRPGEKLLAAQLGEELAGIGGLTIDPADPGALRMRRFYVRSRFRRRGIARALALRLIAEARRAGGRLTVNAQVSSFAFWESVGFRPDARDGHTHILPG